MKHRVPALIITVLAVWMLLDVRWTADRVRQAGPSWGALTTRTVDQRIGDSEFGGYYPWVSRIRDELIGADPARVLLIRDPAEYEYYGWRSKYQLLPHAVALLPGLHREVPSDALEYVLFLGEFASADGPPSLHRTLERLPMARSWADHLELVHFSPQGVLFRIPKD